jgi:hypothetical protein
VEFFTNPDEVNHRRYEALRAFFLDGLTHAQAGERFGYTRWVRLLPGTAADVALRSDEP